MKSRQRDYILTVPLFGSESQQEELQGLLYLTECGGSVVVPKEQGQFLECYFATSAGRDDARRLIADALPVPMEDVDRDRVDWLERYEDSLVAKVIGDRFVVAPRADLVADPIGSGERIPIIIPQERAFGTGNHESTALCLAMLEKAECRDAFGVDIGTGSGILAIAMAKLGCRRVVAFDNDPDVIGAVEENMRRNSLDAHHIVTFIGGPEAISGSGFDVATMNILPEVIIPLLPHVRSTLRGGAELIVSGILRERSDWVVSEACAARFDLVDESSDGEWWCGRLVASG